MDIELEQTGVDRGAHSIVRADEVFRQQRTRHDADVHFDVQGAAGQFSQLDTPHGVIAKRESSHLHFTTDQLTAAIKAGTAKHPGRSVLCRDGYWTPAD